MALKQPDNRKKANLGGEYIDSAFCPLCLKQIFEYHVVGRVKGMPTETERYFDSVKRKDGKTHPFGMRRPTSGRGSFTNWQHINPEDNPELFEEVKRNLLLAIREWAVEKKWVSAEEIDNALK